MLTAYQHPADVAGCLKSISATNLREAGEALDGLPPAAFAGRAILHFLVALGLWQRIALCRSIAMVYCLAVVPTYAAALALAYAGAPFRFPPSVVLQSFYQVPSCILLFRFLRSEQASLLFTRPLLGR